MGIRKGNRQVPLRGLEIAVPDSRSVDGHGAYRTRAQAQVIAPAPIAEIVL